eukprot:CAMPEP_0174850216 /NCGR_PEP_ID=MMETSP1114-20130205/19102_1 /TAXON_ID=312471 /ORGANISM="Neobodo designis, Strain CCAP 1951/1" /LENGTH=523 /DNA_ID=CAMNT_0016084655 /DNA_START=308 /DNA_END=1876 /DNA_ORIENTATION=-
MLKREDDADGDACPGGRDDTCVPGIEPRAVSHGGSRASSWVRCHQPRRKSCRSEPNCWMICRSPPSFFSPLFLLFLCSLVLVGLGAQQRAELVEHAVHHRLELDRVAAATLHLGEAEPGRRRRRAHDVERQEAVRAVVEAAALVLAGRLDAAAEADERLRQVVVRALDEEVVRLLRRVDLRLPRRVRVDDAAREARHDGEGVERAGLRRRGGRGRGGGLGWARGVLRRLARVGDGAVDLLGRRLLDLPGGDERLVGVDEEPRVLHHLLQPEALRRVDDDELRDQVLRALGEVSRHAEVATLDLVEERVLVGVIEGEVAGEHHEEDDAARPRVGLEAVVPALLEHLGGDVVGGAAHGLEQRRAVGRLEVRQAEVGDLQVVVLVEEEVLGFDVAVRDALRVAVTHAGDKLLEEPPGGGLVEALGLDDAVEELAALDHLEHHVDVVGGLHHLAQVHDVRVVEALHDGDLALELLLEVLARQLLLVDDLDGPLLARLVVGGELHLGEGAGAERVPELILSDLLAHGW